jgi:integrase
MSSIARNNRYQEGSIDRVSRANGPDVWVYRWRELNEDAVRVQRKKTIGTVEEYPKKSDIKREVENLRSEINARQERVGKITVADAWGHFQLHELHVNRSPTTICGYLDYFKTQILPEWKDVPLEDVKAVAVEKWLRSLPYANGTKAKIRNHLSCLFTHSIRHEMYTKLNPIASVRQSAVREKEPEVLTIPEIGQILSRIEAEPVRVMVAVAAVSALRRSEFRGLKWSDIDFSGEWIFPRRGVIRKLQSNLKTAASRKRVPLHPELAALLEDWRSKTPYPKDDDWLFASPFTDGERPYWPESAMVDYVRPAAKKAGIGKHIGWHTFRHSVATALSQAGENVKVVQELLRHANSRITQDIYQQANQDAKRSALGHFTGIFVVPAAKSA